ncbi:MAG: hypothetical protein B6U76_00100 [Desulfurococcales archaeon ex4484_217_2]|nr:MAG: hypothetical protein B6U76_00100 [Desulfurococcales archaeon ex4484_217_2]
MAAMIPTLPNKDASRSTSLKLYTGEVIKAFREKNIGMGLIKNREISGGKTAQFIVTGQASETDIQTHVRGEEVVSSILANDEVTITVDTRFVHSHFLDTLDEKLAQYEVRGELAFQSGEVLATKIDKEVFAMLGNDVPAMTPLPGQKAATTIVATGYSAATTAEEKGNAIVEALFAGRSALNEKNVSAEPAVIVAPQDYYNIVQSTRGVNADYTSNNGGIDTGKVRQVAGFSIGWTNHLDKTTNPDLIALMFTKDVAGIVKAMDIRSEANYDFRRLGWQLTSFYALGMGPLNPTGMVILNSD